MKCPDCEEVIRAHDHTTVVVRGGLPLVAHAKCPKAPPSDPELEHRHDPDGSRVIIRRPK